MAPPRRVFAALTASALLMLLSLTVLASNAPASQPLDRRGSVIISPSATNNFDQLVVVLMENKNLNEVYGPAPYMTQLADQYSFSQGWSSITNPSQPNYIAIMGASTFGVGGDGNHPNLNHPTLVDLIETSGHTWNAIAEGSGSGCSINPDRGEDHFPFLSYTTITGNAARCANLHSGGPADVVTALNAGTNFIWFTPNDGHNMHDNSVASGDAWIQSWVPGLLTAMAGKKAALILMFDEAYTSPPYIYFPFCVPAHKLAYKSTASYSHYSLAKLLEDVWGGGSLGQGDVNAPSPLEFFGAGGPDFTLTARSEEHTSELQSRLHPVCRLLLEKKRQGADPGSSMALGEWREFVHALELPPMQDLRSPNETCQAPAQGRSNTSGNTRWKSPENPASWALAAAS